VQSVLNVGLDTWHWTGGKSVTIELQRALEVTVAKVVDQVAEKANSLELTTLTDRDFQPSAKGNVEGCVAPR